MTSSAAQPSLSLRLLNAIDLRSLEHEPGPLHTILQDEDRNLYCSDEINHSLACLNSSGEVRWQRTAHGKNPGEFSYPKGIDIGWIEFHGRREDCVAVCDSWNCRIQFFDRNGRFLTSWERAGDACFRDVVDIRFILTGLDPFRGQPCWIVLDRDHHCLFGLDPSGQLLLRMGRPFPEDLESRWPTPFDNPDPQSHPAERLHEFLPYDPLFMPLRIFGDTPDALYVWEPKSRRLKQAVSGNLLPVWIAPPSGSEWTGAGEDGWITFDRHSAHVSVYDFYGRSWRSSEVDGIPVHSRSGGDFWMQDGCMIRQLEPEAAGKTGLPEVPRSILMLRAEIEHIFGSSGNDGHQNIAAILKILTDRMKDRPDSEIAENELVSEILSELRRIGDQQLLQTRRISYLIFLALLKARALRS